MILHPIFPLFWETTLIAGECYNLTFLPPEAISHHSNLYKGHHWLQYLINFLLFSVPPCPTISLQCFNIQPKGDFSQGLLLPFPIWGNSSALGAEEVWTVIRRNSVKWGQWTSIVIVYVCSRNVGMVTGHGCGVWSHRHTALRRQLQFWGDACPSSSNKGETGRRLPFFL